MTNQYTTSTWAQVILNQKFTAVKLNKKYKENTSGSKENTTNSQYDVRAKRYESSTHLHSYTKNNNNISDDISGQRLLHLKIFYESTKAMKYLLFIGYVILSQI